MSPEPCNGSVTGVAYEMPTSEVSNINPNRAERRVFTEILRAHTLGGVYYLNLVYAKVQML